MHIVPLTPEYDAAIAALIRENLRANRLDIPGTAYFDEGLDHLSAFYQHPGRSYYVLLENGAAVGGIGVAEFRGDCCELQKLYLADAAKGRGYGYELIRLIEDQARTLGYRRIYLETHTNLAVAIHVYERSGYRQIPRPEGVVHGTMNRFYLKDLQSPDSVKCPGRIPSIPCRGAAPGEKRVERIEIMDDGIRLVGLLERPHSGRSPLVILLHGFTSSKDRPHTLAACEAMWEAGCATLRFDLYGHGESGGAFRKHTLFKWISNTLAVIDYAQTQDFVTEIWLSGHSQGGLTAALVAGMAPDLIRGLILRAPAFMIPRCAREGSMLGQTFDPCRIPHEFPTIKGLTLEGTYVRTAGMIRVEDAIDRFPGPVLLLHGAEDDVVPLSDSLEAARRYRNCRLEILEGETHHFDRATEHTQACIRDWLRQW